MVGATTVSSTFIGEVGRQTGCCSPRWRNPWFLQSVCSEAVRWTPSLCCWAIFRIRTNPSRAAFATAKLNVSPDPDPALFESAQGILVDGGRYHSSPSSAVRDRTIAPRAVHSGTVSPGATPYTLRTQILQNDVRHTLGTDGYWCRDRREPLFTPELAPSRWPRCAPAFRHASLAERSSPDHVPEHSGARR